MTETSGTADAVSAEEITRRTILRKDWVPCKAAFIDCRTPGSDRKDNYSFIGSGVSQSSQQFVNLTDSHATVTCTWQVAFVGSAGGMQRSSPKVTIRLQKSNGNWFIVDRR